ncbi:MAG: tetratricopeptide repeat protein, partial [Thaumarchaeota archaeon S14]
ADECPVCGTDRVTVTVPGGVTVEELCGRNRGKRTFTLAPPAGLAPDLSRIEDFARFNDIRVEQTGEMGRLVHIDNPYGIRSYGKDGMGSFTHSFAYRDVSANFMADGSAVIVGVRDEEEALELYNQLLDRNADALRELESAISNEPGNAMAHRLKSRAFIVLDALDIALASAEKAVSLDPENPRSHRVKATALYLLGKHGEALKSLDTAIELDPNDADSHSNRAAVLTDLDRPEDALTALRVAARGAGT